MKNEYEIRGDVTAIKLVKADGTELETLISTFDLNIAKQFPNRWYARWSENPRSYYVSGRLVVDGKTKYPILHRWILGVKDPMRIVDHINHDTLDNTRGNLRIVTNAENHQNRRGATSASKSGIRGVYWNEQIGRWVVQVYKNNKRVYASTFKSLREAEEAAIEARIRFLPFSQEALQAKRGASF